MVFVVDEFPVLRQKTVRIPVVPADDDLSTDVVEVLFSDRFLVLDIILPEFSPSLAEAFAVRNLYPYELCVRKYVFNDYKYDKGQIFEVGNRQFRGVDTLRENISTPSEFFTLVVCYLEFPKNQ